VSDITYIWTDEGWLFVVMVIDLFVGVGDKMSKSVEEKMSRSGAVGS